MDTEKIHSFEPIPKATRTELFFWLMKKRTRFIVTGNSMIPTLRPKDVVFLSKDIRAVQVGDIVVCHHPDNDKKIVKRVQKKEGETLFLIGDNASESSDSRKFGRVSIQRCIGIVRSVVV